MIQKYINFHYSVSLDLFGSETSTNVANYYTAGLKGRWMENRRKDDHQLHRPTHGRRRSSRTAGWPPKTVPMLIALNLDLRNEYVADCAERRQALEPELEDAGLERAAVPAAPGRSTARSAPSPATTSRPTGEIVDDATWEQSVGDWLPTPDDRAQVAELMVPHYEAGEFAGWISPPSVGINSLPVEYDYVRF